MKTEIKLITPAIAELLLKQNTMNRRIKEADLTSYIRQMRNGLWKENTGESIKIASDGSILDGQHRLLAILKSGRSLNFLVISELEKEVFTVLDSGLRRTSGDVFYISDVPNARNMAAMIQKYYLLKAGNSLQRNSRAVTSTELLNMYRNRMDFWKQTMNMSETWYNKSQRLLKISEIGALFAIFYDISDTEAFIFMDKLCIGDNLEIGNPIKQLRDKLMFANMNKKFTLNPTVKTAYIYKAWNLIRGKAKTKVFKFNPELDNYPVPI